MGLTLKIAAGIVIGLMAAYLLIGKTSERQFEQKSNEGYATQELNTAAMLFMLSVETYFDEYGAVPGSLRNVSCYEYQRCVTGKRENAFFISRMGEWMSIEPYLDAGQLRFDCRMTVRSQHVPLNRRIRDCGELDPEDIPDFRALQE